MALLTNNIIKSITTKLPRTLAQYGLVQNKISLYFAIRFKTSSPDQLNEESGSCVRSLLYAPVQCEKDKKSRKVTVVGGGGHIGQITAYDLLLSRFCDELVLYDQPTDQPVHGVALDMLGGVSLRDHPNVKECTTGELTKDSDLVILCAGKGVAKGQTRLDALQDNVEIFRTLIPKLAQLSPNSVILIATNPADIMTYVAWKFSGFPFQRVVGTGTELDTSRFKYFLSRRLGISPKCINAWIIGEHGLSCVPCWSSINVAGTRLRDIYPCFGLDNDPDKWFELDTEVKQMANHIKGFKGFTCYSIAMITSAIAQAILTNAKTIHAVSTCGNNLHGFKVASFLSLPAVIGSSGVNYIVRQVLDCSEKEKLIKSAAVLDKAISGIKF